MEQQIEERVLDSMTNNKKEKKDMTKLSKRDKVAVKEEKKAKRLSNINLMKSLLKAKTKDAEIVAAFTKRYKEKGVTDKDFIAKRIGIYKKIASA